MKKRILSLALVLVMLVGMLPVFAQAEEPETTVDNGELTVEGTNGFGTLLSEDIAQEQEQLQEQEASGYTLTDLEITGNTATVTYDSLEEATVVVAVYTEDGMQLLTSGKTTVLPEETMATVTIEGEMPQYFLASAYLLDSYDMSPLCPAYDTPMYTQEMQALLASTAEDYDPERVLQLEESPETNFAVYAETTKVIQQAEGVNTVASVDDETNTYVIENANESITSLKEGDVFAYPYEENEILVVKVASITMDGSTATITAGDLELEEAFSHIKVEGESGTEDLTVDDSTAAEGITYEGLVTEGSVARALTGSGTGTAFHKFDIKEKIEEETDDLSASASISGSLKLQVVVSVNYYVTLTKCYVEFKVTPSVVAGVTIEGSISGKLPIGTFGVSPVPGVYVGFEPQLKLTFTGKISITVTLSTTIGIRYDNTNGLANISTVPTITPSLNVETTLFLGIDFAPKVTILGDSTLKLSLSAAVGVELTAKGKGTHYEYFTGTEAHRHTCEECLDISMTFKANLTGSIKFLNAKWLEVKVNIGKWSVPLGKAYYSLDQEQFGFGTCPNLTYRVTIEVTDSNGEAVSFADVTTSAGEELGIANNNGILVVYLAPGKYLFYATIDDVIVPKTVVIKSACTVQIRPISDADNNECGILGSIDEDTLKDYGYVTASGTCGENLTWRLSSSGTLCISGTGAMEDYYEGNVILSTPWSKDKVKRVVIENGVTGIGNGAFYGCGSLTSVTIGNSVTGIGERAFYNCSSLTSGSIGNSVTSIGGYAFYGCTSLTSVTLPNSVTSIGERAFYDCSSLTRATIGNGDIGVSAFQNCGSLTSVTIGNGVTMIGQNAFKNCGNLNYNGYDNAKYLGNEQNPYYALIKAVSTSIDSCIIHPDTKVLAGNAFWSRTNLTSVTIPYGVVSIGNNVFYSCTSLTSVTIPNSVTRMGDKVFYNCTELTTVNIPNGITSIPKGTFYNCDSLDDFSLPNSITTIEANAFYHCHGISTVSSPKFTIPNSVTTIGNAAFMYCENLTTLTIPNSVVTIADSAFHMTRLVSVKIPVSVTSIGEYVFTNYGTKIYYGGSEEQWDAIDMGGNNYGIDTIYYNSAVRMAAQVSNNMSSVYSYGGTLDGQISGQISSADAVFGGEYGTEIADPYTVKTASFTDLAAGKEYVLLAMVSLDAENPLSGDNLLFINQAVAGEDGSLSFQYVQRVDTAVSYVMACGASNKDLANAEITFQQLIADGETQVVKPVVVYDGKTLVEGQDYVIAGDVDFTDSGAYTCYIRGIYNYTGLVACTYTVDETTSYAWQATDSGFVSVYGNGYTYNDTTLLSGTYTGSSDTGTMSSVQYSLGETVVLKHDQPWVLEFKSGGNTYAGGIMLLNKEADSSTDGNMYIHITQSNVLFGYRDSVGYNNSGIAWTTIAEKLGSTAGADIRKEMLEFKVVNVPDGSNNKLWLYVNGVEIGTMDSVKMIGSDASHASVSAINISGKDFVFNYLGSATHSWNNCNISYIRAYESGQLEPVTEFADYRWELDSTGNTFASADNESFVKNELTMLSGSVSEGQFTGTAFEMQQSVILMHDKAWTVEWASEGDWTDNRNGAMLLSTSLNCNSECAPYIYRRSSSDFIAFGERRDNAYHNYGIGLADNGIDGTVYHKYTLRNELTRDTDNTVTDNMVYLYVDDVKVGPLTKHYIGGSDNGDTSDWISGKDFVFANIGTTAFTVGGCSIDYLQINTDCTHTFDSWNVTAEATCTTEGTQSRSCLLCGMIETSVISATGHSYLDGICTVCGGADPDYVAPVTQPTLTLKYPTVSFEDVILMNVYFDAADLEDVVDMGLITYSGQVSEWNVDNAEAVISGYTYSETNGLYYATTEGIAAKDLSDTLWFAVYAELTDGSYVYTKLVSYSPKTYAYTQLTYGNESTKALVVAMLNYGAAAQTFFDYNTDALANSDLTADDQALIESYRADMMDTVATPSAAKQGEFANNGGYAKRYPTVSFEGAFSINYYYTPSYAPVGDITMYYWNQADFDAADVLTAENATGAIKMNGEGTGEYHAAVEGIAAKDLDKGVYVSFCYSDGTTSYASGVLAYSIGSYCVTQAGYATTLQPFAQATAVYGYYAKQLFG